MDVKLKTYSHLMGLKRMPREYELLTSKLLYYTRHGFEVETPVSEWYRKYQQKSPLQCPDWEAFEDPRQTTYASYTALQSSKEAFVDGLLESIEAKRYDEALKAPWVEMLARTLAPLRYPCHGLQMAACYVGSMAPSGRIAAASLFQAADEMRRIQRLAYRMRQIQNFFPDFGNDSKERWQKDPLWQGLREVVERLLTAYDWGESFTALNLALKPAFDELFMVHLGDAAKRRGDPLLSEIFFSLNEDCRWHKEWSAALERSAVKQDSRNAEIFRGWLGKWKPLTRDALAPLEEILEKKGTKSR